MLSAGTMHQGSLRSGKHGGGTLHPVMLVAACLCLCGTGSSHDAALRDAFACCNTLPAQYLRGWLRMRSLSGIQCAIWSGKGRRKPIYH